MGMYKPWRSPPPAAADEFDFVFSESGETDTLNVRIEIVSGDEDDSGPLPPYANLMGIWAGTGWVGPDDLNPKFVDRLCMFGMDVFTGKRKMAEAEYRIAKLEECAA